MQKQINLEEVKDYIEAQSPETKIYIGCDSERMRIGGVWFADYTLVIIVHIDGKHGCKIFGQVERERDYDQNRSRPAQRLMMEVYKVAELYLKLSEVLEGRDVSVHLDINPDERHGSSCVISQAVGYIRGVCGVDPMVKPNSWAASFAADRYKGLKIAA